MGLNLPAISGNELIKLLIKDGWIKLREAPHGTFLYKTLNQEKLTTTIPRKDDSLPKGTLGAILSSKQTRLGSKGLLELIQKHAK
jgi:predicted RNA binding protein YcfA (HicA-like mRNA interferase family)